MKNFPKKVWFLIGGVAVVVVLVVLGLNSGSLFQGNLRVMPGDYTSQPRDYTSQPQGYTSTPNGYTSQPQGYTSTPNGYTSQPQGYTSQSGTSSSYTSQPSDYTSLQIMPTSNQLRLGSNSLLKLVVQNGRDTVLKRIKMNLAMFDLSINDVKLIMNGTDDVTDQLTSGTRTMLNTSLRAANKKNLDTTFVLAFQDNFKLPAGTTTFELIFNTDSLNNDSTLLGSVLDAVVDMGSIEKVIDGPLQKIMLQTTYTTH